MDIWKKIFGGWLLGALLLGWIGQAVAAVTFKGVVVEHRERGEPAAGVEINADGANQTRSVSSGQFTLVFPDGKPGQAVRLIVQRPGWVVVNSLLLESRLPDRPDSLPLELVICRAAEREQRLMDFYGLKGNQFAEQNYRRELAELERQNKATAAERDRLQRELEAARKESGTFARQFASQADTELSELNREALQLFQAGRFAEALQRLSEERLQREAADAQKKLAETAQSYKMRAQMLALNFDFEGAGKAYGEATRLLPGSYDVWSDYADFHLQLKQFHEARRGYTRMLMLAREEGDSSKIADMLNNLGILHHAENRLGEARQASEEALKIRRELAARNPQAYLPVVAATLNNLGNLHLAENRLGEAMQAYEEALKIRRELATRNPQAHLPYVAMTLNNLGNLRSDEKRLGEAMQAYEEALKIRRELATRNPQEYLPQVAETLNMTLPLESVSHSCAHAQASRG